ncbi:MAG: class B sortase [Lachnospiraceae bacterium]|nr:class B sortase [Lachnospiraceae bacterium]
MGKEGKIRVWLVCMMLFLVIAAVATGVVFYEKQTKKEAEEAFALMQENVSKETKEPETEESEKKKEKPVQSRQQEEMPEEKDVLKERGITIPDKEIDWSALSEQNPHIYAWIVVDDTTVDYPVLQHPTDDTFYLNGNLDGSVGYPGCLYTEAGYNKKDFSDPHTVIYGHNLKDHTMFSTLHNFDDEKTFFAKDHFIYIYTKDYTYVYEIFGAYEYSSAHLLDNYDFSNDYVFDDFINRLYHNETGRIVHMKEGVDVKAGDRILTLSTCTKDSNENLRFLVTGVLLNPKED